jgi:transposase
MREEFTMAKTRYARHSAAFRDEAIRQARSSGQPLSKLARDLGVNYGTLRLWVKEAEAPEESDPVTSSERLELRRLRQEVRELRMERDILKKATAFFAKHSK